MVINQIRLTSVLMVWKFVYEYAVETHREFFVETHVPNIQLTDPKCVTGDGKM